MGYALYAAQMLPACGLRPAAAGYALACSALAASTETGPLRITISDDLTNSMENAEWYST